MKYDKTIQRVWESLEELERQMTSSAAEGLTQEQIEFVDERLSAILEETSRWFAVQDNGAP